MSGSTLVVVNPASANGRTGRRWVEMASRLRGQLADFEVAMTERPLQATALVRDALQRGVDHIVSVGGDGTHNEVVNGFFEGTTALAPEAKLSIIPTGTGGDLRRSLGLPESTLGAIDYVGQRPTPVDVGRLTCVAPDGGQAHNHFINISSFGASGKVVDTVNHTTKAFGAKISFLWAAAKVTAGWRNTRVRFTLDPDTAHSKHLDHPIYIVAVANARYFGGGMHIAPGAVMNDGLFDVVVMGDMPKSMIITKSNTIYSGTHIELDPVEVYRARTIVAEPASPDTDVFIDMDGEMPGRLPATWTLVPDALRLCHGPDPSAIKTA